MTSNTKKNNSRAKSNRKVFIIILSIIFALVFVVFIFDFASIVSTGQAKGANLTYRTKFKYSRKRTIVAKRGDIYDADGEVIASDAGEFSMYAIIDKSSKDANNKPNYVSDKEKTAEVLSKYIPLSKKKILNYLSPENKNIYQVEFGPAGKNLTLHVKNKIEAKKLPGIMFTKTPSRSYPNGIFATNTVGITKIANKDDPSDLQRVTGMMGIEKYFNKDLSGQDGLKIAKVDSKGNELPETKVITKQAKNGKDIYLTLDSRLQDYAEVLMDQVQDRYNPVDLQTTVMDAKTGAIKVASQRPTFNPATLDGIDKSWRNTLVEDQFEPGSIMKILALSASIDSGNYKPNEYYTSGSVKVDDRIIRDWNYTGWGSIPIKEAFPRSSNVGMVHLEQEMGSKTWLKYINKFHLGEKTNIELPGETAGKVQFSSKSDQAMSSFGQSTTVTNMQMLQAISAIANNGKMVKPQIIKKIVDPDTKAEEKTRRTVVGQPISAKTAQKVKSAMEDVVYKDYGTGAAYKIPGYKIALKTGTAQIASPSGGYLTGDSNYIFSVAGLLPANNPRYIVYITMKQPRNMSKAPETILSEIFNPLAVRLLKSETGQDASGDTSEVNQVKVKNYTGNSLESASSQLKEVGLNTVVIGTGSNVVQQLPKPGEKILKDQKIMLMTNGAMTMPDVTGWSKNDILKLSEITGKKIKITGIGYAVDQNVKSGELLNKQKNISIKLGNKLYK